MSTNKIKHGIEVTLGSLHIINSAWTREAYRHLPQEVWQYALDTSVFFKCVATNALYSEHDRREEYPAIKTSSTSFDAAFGWCLAVYLARELTAWTVLGNNTSLAVTFQTDPSGLFSITADTFAKVPCLDFIGSRISITPELKVLIKEAPSELECGQVPGLIWALWLTKNEHMRPSNVLDQIIKI